MDDEDLLATQFEEHRVRLRAVSYRMLGSVAEAEDAVQEAWLRLSRSDADTIANLQGWLTTVVARVSLDMLRARRARHEDDTGSRLPEPLVSTQGGTDPEEEALIADSVGLALLVVLDTLPPKERLAFVLHDTFGVPFDEIAPIVDRSPDAARKLASRARRRIQGAPVSDADLPRQQELVHAFLAAAREGDFDALVAVLDPDVVLRLDRGPVAGRGDEPITGAEPVARRLLSGAQAFAPYARAALVNGAAGAIVSPRGKTVAVVGFTVVGDRIVEIDLIADPAKLRGLEG